MDKRTLAVGMGVVLVVVGLVAGVGSPGWAAPPHQARSVITYPTSGMIVSGVVEVQGIAIHPNIRSYQVRYAAGPQPAGDSQWVDFAVVEGTPVDNGVLGTWDTTVIPDGVYTLALAVWGADDAASPYVFFVTNLTVDNSQVASPTPTEEIPTPEPMPTAVIETPTPVTIEQPPTPTSLSVPSPVAEETLEGTPVPVTEEEGDGLDLPLDLSQLRAAFFTGGKITLFLFLLWGLYSLVKVTVRWLLRRRSVSSWK